MKIKCDLLDLTTIIILLWYINPMSMDYYNWTIFAVLAIIWIFLAASYDFEGFSRHVCNRQMLFYGFFIVVLFCYALVDHTPFYLQSLSVPFAFLVGQFYLLERDVQSQKRVMRFANLYIFIITINTIIKLVANPNISRYLAGGNSELTRNLITPFVGGFSFVYISVLFSVNAFANLLMKEENRKQYKVLNIFQFVAGIVFIVLAQYLTAMILLALGCLIVLLLSPAKEKYKILGVLIVIAGAGTLVFGVLPEILHYLASLFPSGQVQDHLNELALTVQLGKGSANDLTRVQIFEKTIDLFLSNPLFGAGYSHNHQEFIDMFAQYGIVGGIPYFAAMFSMINKTCRDFRYSNYRMSVIISMIIFIALLFLNSAGDGVIYMSLFLIIPVRTIISSLDKQSL